MAASRPIVGLRAALADALCSSDESSEDDSSSSSDDDDEDDRLELFLMMTSNASADIQQSLRGGIGSWWVKPRSIHWINALVQSTTLFDDSRFYENFRMRRSSWWVLFDAVRGEITKETTSLRSPVPPETALLLFLYFCAHSVSYRVLSEKFGVGHSTCHYILRRVADAICNLGLVKRPTHAEAAKITRANERRSDVSQCLLSVDGTHIPIVQPPHSGKAYYNRKGFYSTVLQAAVDNDLVFRDVIIGWPGSVGDNRVFMNSDLGRDHESWLSSFPTRVVPTGDGHVEELPMFLIGDSAYANTKYMVTTYEMSQIIQSAKARRSNQALSAVRYQVEHAFGVLKGRFRLLAKPIHQDFSFVPRLVFAICSVHNLLIVKRDHIDQNDVLLDIACDGHEQLRAQEGSSAATRRIIED